MKRYDVYSESGCGNCGIEEDADGDLLLYEDVVQLLVWLGHSAELALAFVPKEKVDG